MTIQVEVNSFLFSSFVYDGRKTKPPQLLAPTFRHAKGSFHTLLLGWALPLSLRDFSYQAFLSGLLPRAGSWCNDDNDLVGQLDFLKSAIIKQGLRVLRSWNPCRCGIVCQKHKHVFFDVAQMKVQVEVNSYGLKTKLPQLLAPTFRHAKGSFHTLLLGWALPLSLRDFSYQQSSQEGTDMFQLQISGNTYPLRHKLHALGLTAGTTPTRYVRRSRPLQASALVSWAKDLAPAFQNSYYLCKSEPGADPALVVEIRAALAANEPEDSSR